MVLGQTAVAATVAVAVAVEVSNTDGSTSTDASWQVAVVQGYRALFTQSRWELHAARSEAHAVVRCSLCNSELVAFDP